VARAEEWRTLVDVTPVSSGCGIAFRFRFSRYKSDRRARIIVLGLLSSPRRSQEFPGALWPVFRCPPMAGFGCPPRGCSLSSGSPNAIAETDHPTKSLPACWLTASDFGCGGACRRLPLPVDQAAERRKITRFVWRAKRKAPASTSTCGRLWPIGLF
jgi:hypothetical protein